MVWLWCRQQCCTSMRRALRIWLSPCTSEAMTVSFAHYQRSLQYQKKEEKKQNIRSIFEPVKPSIQAIHKPSIQTSQWVPVAWPPPFDLRSLSALWPPGPFTSRPFGLPALWPPKKKRLKQFCIKKDEMLTDDNTPGGQWAENGPLTSRSSQICLLTADIAIAVQLFWECHHSFR